MATTAVSSSVGMMLTGSVPLLVILGIMRGVGWSFAPIVLTVPFELAGITPREIAVAMGVLEVALRTGSVAGPLIAGFLQEANGDLAMALIVTSLFGLFMVAAALMAFGKGNGKMHVTSPSDT